MKTKVIALDIYGTILSTKWSNIQRKGLEDFLFRCKSEGLTICTCSDGETQDVKDNLSEAGINLNYFDEYFKMLRQPGDFTKQPKEFESILSYYNISPNELTVIGDREERDIAPAKKLGCNTILVPEYKTPKDKNYFDMNQIEIP